MKVFAQVWVKEVVGGTPSLSIINRYFGPVQATLDLECNHCEIKNKSKRFILEARGQEFAFKLDPKIKNWRAKYSLGVLLGDPKAEPDDYRYRLPFPELVGYLITQALMAHLVIRMRLTFIRLMWHFRWRLQFWLLEEVS